MKFRSYCNICDQWHLFEAKDDYYDCRGGLKSERCPYGSCATRERAMATTLFGLVLRETLPHKVIFECSPCIRGLSLWLKRHVPGYTPTGFFPDKPFGSTVQGLRNEDLERLTLPDESVDIWLHLDVLEHLYQPFQAMREIYRTLCPGGVCLFTVPTYPDRVRSEQVAFLQTDGTIRTIGEPEYHGNPQHSEQGALVTWRYGYDLPLLITRETGFDVEVRRWQSKAIAVMGPMTEVYICRKPG